MTAYPMPQLPDGRKPRVTSGYGPRKGGHYDFHYGADILYPFQGGDQLGLPWTNWNQRWTVPSGVPALAARDGVVTRSGKIGTGDRVRIDHGGGLATGYMHLSSRDVGVGDRVERGQPVGIVGYDISKGKVALNHLHFELYKNGQQVNPAAFLRAAQVLPMPSHGWLILAGLAVVGGLWASRYL